MKIVKNVIKNELLLIAFLGLQEILRILMNAGDYMGINLIQATMMLGIVGVLSVVQQLIRDRYRKKAIN